MIGCLVKWVSSGCWKWYFCIFLIEFINVDLSLQNFFVCNFKGIRLCLCWKQLCFLWCWELVQFPSEVGYWKQINYNSSLLTNTYTHAALPEWILVSEVKYSRQSETFIITSKSCCKFRKRVPELLNNL